ncbi:MAG: DMT family transporter [Pseudomonadota bacterium]
MKKLPETRELPAATPSADQPGLAASLLVTSLFFLALQDGLVKIASTDVSIWQFQTLRSALNLLMLVILARFIWGTVRPRPKRFWAVALRSLFLVGAMIFYFGAIPFLSLAQIASGLYTFPLFVALLSFLVLKERVGPRRVLAILAGFCGTLLIMKPGTDAFSYTMLMPIGAGLCYAATVVTTRRLCREESPVTLAFGVSLCFVSAGILGTVFFSAVSFPELAAAWPYLFTGWHPIGTGLLLLVAACSVLNLFANIGLAKAYQSAEASWLAPFDYSYLVFATGWGFVLWGHLPDAVSLAGMVVIAVSGGFVAWRERQENSARGADFNRSLR